MPGKRHITGEALEVGMGGLLCARKGRGAETEKESGVDEAGGLAGPGREGFVITRRSLNFILWKMLRGHPQTRVLVPSAAGSVDC